MWSPHSKSEVGYTRFLKKGSECKGLIKKLSTDRFRSIEAARGKGNFAHSKYWQQNMRRTQHFKLVTERLRLFHLVKWETYMQTAHPPYNDNCVDRGVKRAPIELPPEPMYAQSNESENTPNPSFPAAPPSVQKCIHQPRGMYGPVDRTYQKSEWTMDYFGSPDKKC